MRECCAKKGQGRCSKSWICPNQIPPACARSPKLNRTYTCTESVAGSTPTLVTVYLMPNGLKRQPHMNAHGAHGIKTPPDAASCPVRHKSLQAWFCQGRNRPGPVQICPPVRILAPGAALGDGVRQPSEGVPASFAGADCGAVFNHLDSHPMPSLSPSNL